METSLADERARRYEPMAYPSDDKLRFTEIRKGGSNAARISRMLVENPSIFGRTPWDPTKNVTVDFPGPAATMTVQLFEQEIRWPREPLGSTSGLVGQPGLLEVSVGFLLEVIVLPCGPRPDGIIHQSHNLVVRLEVHEPFSEQYLLLGREAKKQTNGRNA